MNCCAAHQQFVGKPAKALSWDSIPDKCSPINYNFNSFRCHFKRGGGGRGKGANWVFAYSDKHRTINVRQRPRTLQRTDCLRPCRNARNVCWVLFVFPTAPENTVISVKCNNHHTKYLCPHKKKPKLHHSLLLGYDLHFMFLALLPWKKQIFMQGDTEQQLILCRL